MATRYCGIGGNDGNSGLTWILRKLTLNGLEDTPVVAGDVCYIGPGAYRETLTVDVSGGAGTEIVYIGDVTGEHTDGIGGVVRITGSDNDQTAARGSCITADGKDHRTFRGFRGDFGSSSTIYLEDCEDWIFEDCNIVESGTYGIRCIGADQLNLTVRRCVFEICGSTASHISFAHSVTLDNRGHLIENCLLSNAAGYGGGVFSSRVGGITIRNSTFHSVYTGVDVVAALAGGQTITVENCILTGCRTALDAQGVGEIVEDFNTFFRNSTDRVNTNTGANSEAYPPLFLTPILHSGASQTSGFKFPWWFGELSEWSPVRAIAGNAELTEDLRGILRPATASKNSWGATQFVDYELESGTVQAGSYGRVLHDAGQALARRIPVTGVEITVTLYMRFEADYEPDPATLPRMIIKQPGAADQIDTMVVAADNWEQLSITFTPNASPGYVEVWAESRNTAAAGSYEVFYDTMGVS